jgi:hypothetical protein
MPTLELTDEQVLQLVRQLPVERRRDALVALAENAARGRNERMERAESQLRRLCAERGLDWDRVSEEQREALVDDLIHEDRACG